MRKKPSQILLCAALLVGLIAALVLCGIRTGMELKNTRVSIVMTQDAAEKLSYLPEQIQIFDGSVMQENAVLLVEDENQYSYVPDEAVDALVGQAPVGTNGGTPCVRCFRLTGKFAARYNYLGYVGAEEIENILYRAVTDRNIRVLWLEPMVDAASGAEITDGAIYEQLIENLSERISRHGLTFSESPTLFPAYAPNMILLILTAIGVSAAGVLLLKYGFGLRDKWSIPLLAVCCVLCAVMLFVMRETAVLMISFACAAIFPCLALTCAQIRLSRAAHGSCGHELSACAAGLGLSFLLALMGGLFVSALQSSTEWLLAIRNFRGVKLSALVPLLYAVYIVLRRLCTPKEILQGKRILLVFTVLVLAAAAVVFLLRTGDGSLAVSALEQRLRNVLEHKFLVRPRSKEFLIAWPCFGLAFALCARGAKRWAWPFAILTAPGFSSVVNTFCHSRAPVWLSAARGVYGFLPGLAIALILTALFHKSKAKGNH